MHVRSFLEYRHFESSSGDDPWVFVETDPLYQVAYVVGEQGAPTRLQSIVNVQVPMHRWEDGVEDDIILRVMVEASHNNVRRVRQWSDLKPPVWAKCTKNLCALATHPDNEGKFVPPPKTPVFYSNEVPTNRLLCLGAREQAGIYLIRGDERGLVLKRKQGILGILVYST